mgnify:CR=1 FL=1
MERQMPPLEAPELEARALTVTSRMRTSMVELPVPVRVPGTLVAGRVAEGDSQEKEATAQRRRQASAAEGVVVRGKRPPAVTPLPLLKEPEALEVVEMVGLQLAGRLERVALPEFRLHITLSAVVAERVGMTPFGGARVGRRAQVPEVEK